MEKKFEKYADCERCPIRNVLDRFGDKWSMLIIAILGETTKLRFSELKKIIPDISQRMLSVTLKKLEEDGLVLRHAYAEVPPRVEYQLSARARSLLPHLQGLMLWAAENMPAILMDRPVLVRE